MPKGRLGWPVSYDDRPRWWTLAIGYVACAFGLPLLIILLTRFLPGARPNAGGGPAFVAVFVGIGLCVVGVIVLAVGRGRYTPTSFLWLPLIGRPRWVHIDDVRRMSFGAFLKFDVGWSIKIKNVPNTKSRRQDFERIRGWLDEVFDLPPRRLTGRQKVNFAILFLCFVVGVPATCHVVTRFVKTFALRQNVQITHWSTAKLFLVALAIMIGLAVVSYAVPCIIYFALVKWFGLKSPHGSRWRPRRTQWQAFEVLPTPILDTAALFHSTGEKDGRTSRPVTSAGTVEPSADSV